MLHIVMIPIIKGGMRLGWVYPQNKELNRPNGNMFLQELLYLREQLILAAEPEKQIMPEKPRGQGKTLWGIWYCYT